MRTKIGVIAVSLMVAACGTDVSSIWDDGGGGGGGPNGDDGGTTPGDDGGTTPGDDGGTMPTGDGSTPTGDSGNPQTGTAPFANAITISEVAMFQAVKISVAKAGAKVTTRSANVVASRDGLLRVYVTPQSGYTPKALTAELKLLVNGSALPLLKDTKTISGASTDASLASTFDFEIPGASLPAGVSYTVAITDPSLGGMRAPGANPAQYPADGTAEAMDAKSTGPQLKVTMVPFQYQADGSGRLPDTSAAQLEIYRQAIYGRYPAAKVDITVHAPFPWASAIDASGNGFSQALQGVVDLRARDNVADDVYYMGIFAPAADFNTYCQGGCVTGLSGVGIDPMDATVRASSGVGFTGSEAGITAAHEIGHAHGRSHAPCGGASGPDPRFPYSTGGIGVWGYSLNTKQLIDPAVGKDLMGYCQPEWISDYHYQLLFTRIATVNHAAAVYDPQHWTSPHPFRFLSVNGDGTATWGQSTIVRNRPRGAEHAVTFHAANSAVIQTVTGYFYEYGDMPGGFMLVPEPPAGTVSTLVVGSNVSTSVRRGF